jgi:hypothetical protein
MTCVLVGYKSRKIGFSLTGYVLVFSVNELSVMKLIDRKAFAELRSMNSDRLESDTRGALLREDRIPYDEISEIRLQVPDWEEKGRIKIRTRKKELQYDLLELGALKTFGIRKPNLSPLTVLLGSKLIFVDIPTSHGKMTRSAEGKLSPRQLKDLQEGTCPLCGKRMRLLEPLGAFDKDQRWYCSNCYSFMTVRRGQQ